MAPTLSDKFLVLTCDQKLTKSQFSPTHVNRENITEELKHNTEWYEVQNGVEDEIYVINY